MEVSQNVSDLIHRIYGAAADASQIHAFMWGIAEEVEADLATLAIGEVDSGELKFSAITPNGLDSDSTHALIRSFFPSLQGVLQRNAAGIHCHDDIDASLARPDQDGLKDLLDLGNGFAAYFPLKKSVFVLLVACRFKNRPPFKAEQLATLQLLMPHIEQALKLNHQLDEIMLMNDLVLKRYQQFSLGIILLDDDGRLVFSNPVARTLLTQEGGISATDGRLASENPAESLKLDQLITQCIQSAHIKGASHEGFLAISRRQQQKPPLSVSVSSYSNKLRARTLAASNGRALVVIYDPERRQITQEYVLERLYDLTPAEAALTTSLTEGKTLAEVAESRSVSRETLRSQLKRVFQKTHTKRQSELIKLVLTGPGSPIV